MRSLNLFFFFRDEKGRLAVFEMVDEWKYLLCIEKWWWEKKSADSHEQQHIHFFPLSFLFVIKTVAQTTAMLPRPFQQTLFQPLHLCYQHFSRRHCIYLILLYLVFSYSMNLCLTKINTRFLALFQKLRQHAVSSTRRPPDGIFFFFFSPSEWGGGVGVGGVCARDGEQWPNC